MLRDNLMMDWHPIQGGVALSPCSLESKEIRINPSWVGPFALVSRLYNLRLREVRDTPFLLFTASG